MTSLWHWLSGNWTAPLNSLVSATIGAIASRFVPSRTESIAKRRKEAQRSLDEKVYRALLDVEVHRSSRGMTAAGMPLNRISEIAAYLEEDRDEVEESLTRLQMRRRVGTNRGDWFVIPD
jgi:hypothetical protein